MGKRIVLILFLFSMARLDAMDYKIVYGINFGKTSIGRINLDYSTNSFKAKVLVKVPFVSIEQDIRTSFKSDGTPAEEFSCNRQNSKTWTNICRFSEDGVLSFDISKGRTNNKVFLPAKHKAACYGPIAFIHLNTLNQVKQTEKYNILVSGKLARFELNKESAEGEFYRLHDEMGDFAFRVEATRKNGFFLAKRFKVEKYVLWGINFSSFNLTLLETDI
jgi:hypothetical protein